MVLWQGWLYVLEPGKEPRRVTGDGQRPVLGGGPGAARQPEIRWTGRRENHLSGERHGESYVYQTSIMDSRESGNDGKAPGMTNGRGMIEERKRASPVTLGGGRLAAGLSLDGGAERAVVASSTRPPRRSCTW